MTDEQRRQRGWIGDPNPSSFLWRGTGRGPASRFTVAAVVVVSLVWAAHRSGVRPGRLFDAAGVSSAWGILAGLARPELGADFLIRVARLSLESLAMGVLGTALAALIGVSLALFGMRVPQLPDPPRGSGVPRAAAEAVRLAVRFVLGVLRSIPDIVWAFLFVRMLGLGPGPAVLAIAVSTGGIMGKLFAELAEAADPGPIHALRRAGAGRLGVLIHGVLPQVQRQWVAYGLFRLECSIRSASIVGVVGAGGLGSEIALSVRYLQFDKLGTTLLAVLALVVASEMASAVLRRRRIHWTVGTVGLGSLAALIYLDIPWSEMWRSSPLVGGLSVSAGWRVAEVVARAWPLVLDTVAMAWCATLAAAVFAFFLAPLASRMLSVGSYLGDPPRRRGPSRALVRLGFAGARTVFQGAAPSRSSPSRSSSSSGSGRAPSPERWPSPSTPWGCSAGSTAMSTRRWSRGRLPPSRRPAPAASPSGCTAWYHRSLRASWRSRSTASRSTCA